MIRRFAAGVGLCLAATACSSASTQALPVPAASSTTTTTTTVPATVTTVTAVTSTSTTTSTTTTTTTTDPGPPISTGTFVRAGGGQFEIAGSPMIEFSIAVEDGSNVSLAELVALVTDTLSDPRGWTGRGVGFRLVDEGGTFTLAVATPPTIDVLCRPLETNGRFSCARNGWIALNLDRWTSATDSWPSDIETYRLYLINHEIGHYIVGASHSACPGAGQSAPLMMQQTKGLDGCVPNGWVDP